MNTPERFRPLLRRLAYGLTSSVLRAYRHLSSQGGVKVPTGGHPEQLASPRALSMGKGQLIRCDSGADGNSPDEREERATTPDVQSRGLCWRCFALMRLFVPWEMTMSQHQLLFDSSAERLQHALAALRDGRGILVVDDENRENEGDMIFAAETLTVEQMALLIREGSGIVCLCLTPEKAALLDLPPMVIHNTNTQGTAFTVSIEGQNVSTGVSAEDRVSTIRAAIADKAKPDDLRRPGHIFPLIARPGGVLERPGHTEATVDLMRLAGLKSCGVLCEVTNPDGTMARLPEILAFGEKHCMPVLTVADVVACRGESLEQEVKMPLL